MRSVDSDDGGDAAENDDFCETLIGGEHVCEAKKWFAKRPEGTARTLGELRTTEESVAEVDELYRAGAVKVTLVDIDYYDEDENTGKLVVTLPKDLQARAKVLAWCAKWARATGYDPETDIGQKYVFVMMD